MSKMDEIWRDMIEHIPKTRAIVREALKKDIEFFEHGKILQGKERNSLRKNFEFLRKKWIVDILYFIHLQKNPHFADIQKGLDGINSRTLTNRLQEMEDLGLISRNVKTGKPIRVFYELTDLGLGVYELLIPLLTFLSMNLKKN
jgi:DNA-binding HxlR family transcriptional regulator